MSYFNIYFWLFFNLVENDFYADSNSQFLYILVKPFENYIMNMFLSSSPLFIYHKNIPLDKKA